MLKLNNVFNRMNTLMLFAMVLFQTSAFGQAVSNPLANVSLTGAAGNTDLKSSMGFWIKLLIVALTFVILFFAFSKSILGIFSSLQDARRDNAWGDFFINLLMVFIGLGVAIFLGYLEFELIDKYSEYWDKM
ncbi:hypothetical protein [Suttonella ornithocola]|uniref:Uncharacterized protein n=1 Tax=Suttonella ornithocola TaxID=279832 RepID=A0A380MXA3_9GAMM|nr:hypothetical protein [Suttonella ornithocola]SUO96666.1 Uncharacterised protein [Suttonella ornithocola]